MLKKLKKILLDRPDGDGVSVGKAGAIASIVSMIASVYFDTEVSAEEVAQLIAAISLAASLFGTRRAIKGGQSDSE